MVLITGIFKTVHLALTTVFDFTNITEEVLRSKYHVAGVRVFLCEIYRFPSRFPTPISNDFSQLMSTFALHAELLSRLNAIVR